ncbi:MAG: dihydroorotate dehydrogenase [Bacteroidetes bacterium GWF2_33_16]|nr:MAG: dihydroorotate dehydrogenase [Bacteroidetes bacterium GWE2_32_14]OFY06641.1 MAG: dihydroorotate dehydrogenase [Bacteroidetes bacterium GWF2_33_16]
MADLTTTYMGLKLKNPLIAGSSNLALKLENIKAMENAGIGAIVFKSLFEEQINLESAHLQDELSIYDDRNAEMIKLFPEMEHAGPKEFLLNLKKTKDAATIPVIASINAIYKESWEEYAKLIEETGVDALEINLYNIPKKVDLTAQKFEEHQIDIVKTIRKTVKIPVAVKLTPYYSNSLNFITEMDKLNVNGFVLFNRLFEPEIDIETEKNIFPFNLSNKGDYRTSLRYTGLLYGNIKADISSGSGIYDGEDVIKMLLAGANTVQIVSTLYKNKFGQITKIIDDLNHWMDKKGYKSINDFRGKLSRKNAKDPFVYLRAQYVDMLLNSSDSFLKKSQV